MQLQDIGEGQTGLVAEVGVSQQLLQQRLPDWLSGVKPKLLGGRVPGHHLAVDVPAGLPEGRGFSRQQGAPAAGGRREEVKLSPST